MIVDRASSSAGPTVDLRQSGFEQRWPARSARIPYCFRTEVIAHVQLALCSMYPHAAIGAQRAPFIALGIITLAIKGSLVA